MKVSEVIEKLRNYKIPELNIHFINREYEIEQLLNRVVNLEISWIHVIYGSWGCGKSEFFRAFTQCSNFTDDYIIIYVDLTETELIKAIHFPEVNLKNFIVKVVEELGSPLSIVPQTYLFISKIIENLS